MDRMDRNEIEQFKTGEWGDYPDLRQDESRAIARIAARAREQKAYELVQKAETHLQAANDYWEQCSTDLRELEDVN